MFDKLAIIMFAVCACSVFLLCVYAVITGNFPTVHISTSRKDLTPSTPSIEYIPESAPGYAECSTGEGVGVSVEQDPDTPNNAPFPEKEEEYVDPLLGLLGITHELFTGGDRVDGKDKKRS